MKLTDLNRDIILKHFREDYEGTCEMCGDDSEEANEAKKQYKKVFSHSLEECWPEIKDFYLLMYEAVGGGIRKYYATEPDVIEMIEKVMEVEEVQKVKKNVIFQSIGNETTRKDGKPLYTISAICDDDGSFEIQISGVGGKTNALLSLNRAIEAIGSNEPLNAKLHTV